MCGIVGYIGDHKKTLEILYDGLKRLEYRGYDSSGISILDDNKAVTIKSQGKLEKLKSKISSSNPSGSIGIGHTRWATHGKPSEENAHPHSFGSIRVVHNGIIENYLDLKEQLEKDGHEFYSETDTEVIAHLIESYLESGLDFETSVREAFQKIEGSYAVAIVSEKEPDKIVVTRKFSPLIVADNGKEKFIASDVPAILPYCQEIVYLEDGDFAVIDAKGIKFTDINGKEVKRESKKISLDPIMVEKSGYRHFMLKEIHEQPRAILDTLRGKFSNEDFSVELEGLDTLLTKEISRISIVGCGTSYHASLIGKYMIESLAKINTEVDLASEFRYREPIIDSSTLVIAVSQSGETADTSEAVLEAKKKGAITLGITNVEMSKIPREADFAVFTKAGPEIGVASTKAFTTQIISFYLLAILLADNKKLISKKIRKDLINGALEIYKRQQQTLSLDEEIKELSKDFYHYKNFIYLGRGINYPVALEGALKLKEISYVHAEGYAAGEMKHGPIALIDEDMPVVFIAPTDAVYYKKMLGNFQEIKARGGRIIFITTDNNCDEFLDDNDRKILIPECSEILSPLLTVIPVQFLAYHIANLLGTDIDQPRNLAKVVTVE